MADNFHMRAWNTVGSQFVYWISLDAPDFVGTESPYPPGDLTDIVVVLVAETDAFAPEVATVEPPNGDTILTTQSLLIVFTEPMNPATLTAANILVVGTGTVPGSFSVQLGDTAVEFTPTDPWVVDQLYSVTIGTGCEDVAGNPLAAPVVSTFTGSAGETPDTDPPSVSETNPPDEGLILDTGVLSITFSEAMDPATLISANIVVERVGVGVIPGTYSVGVGDTVVTFDPSTNWSPGSTYTATIGVGCTDAAGNPLSAPVVVTFQAYRSEGSWPERYFAAFNPADFDDVNATLGIDVLGSSGYTNQTRGANPWDAGTGAWTDRSFGTGFNPVDYNDTDATLGIDVLGGTGYVYMTRDAPIAAAEETFSHTAPSIVPD